MNRQRYLAELQRLLVFMTEEDRERIIRRYAALFDAAGPEGEEALISSLGTPTKAAIGLSRGYEPGALPKKLPGQPDFVPPEEEPTAPEPKKDELWGEMPFFEPVTPEIPQKPSTPEPEPAPEAPPAPEPPAAPPPEPAAVYERSMPLGLGIVLFIFVFGALGIPLAALCLALMLALLVPGCACVFGAYLIAVGGLWSMSFAADAIFLFGLAFIALAIGLIVLWAGLFIAIKLAGVYVKGVGWLAGELFGRRVTAYE